MGDKSTSLKPFYLEVKKSGPKGGISETVYSKWQQVILANIKKEQRWIPYTRPATVEPATTPNWNTSEANHGLTADKCVDVEAMLTYVAQYAPSALHRDITR